MWGLGYLLMYVVYLCSLFLLGLNPKCIISISRRTAMGSVQLCDLVGPTEILMTAPEEQPQIHSHFVPQ